MFFGVAARHTVFDDPNVVVLLEPVTHRPEHTNVGVNTSNQQSLNPEKVQQDVQLRSEEAAVTALHHPQIPRLWGKLVHDLDSTSTLDTVKRDRRIGPSARITGASPGVELPTRIHPVLSRTVRLLGKDDRHVRRPSRFDNAGNSWHHLHPARSAEQRVTVDEIVLHVDNEHRWPADD